MVKTSDRCHVTMSACFVSFILFPVTVYPKTLHILIFEWETTNAAVNPPNFWVFKSFKNMFGKLLYLVWGKLRLNLLLEYVSKAYILSNLAILGRLNVKSQNIEQSAKVVLNYPESRRTITCTTLLQRVTRDLSPQISVPVTGMGHSYRRSQAPHRQYAEGKTRREN
jgi:hypothetical protein